MKFTKTPDTKGLAFSPWELRPGSTVQVDYSYVAVQQYDWYSDNSTSVMVSGTVWPTSVQADWPIPEDNITITPSGLYSTVDIEAITHGPTTLNIYYRVDVTENLTAVSAITEATSTYYDDWFLDEEGVPTPMTVVPLVLPINQQVYKPEDFTVTITNPERGVSTLNGDVWTSNAEGTLKMIDHTDDFSVSRNLFRKGKVQVLLPMASKLEPAIRYQLTNGQKTGKYVEMDVQEWYPNRLSVRGILWHRDKLYVLTDDGLYSFDRWGDFSQPENHYSNVTGHDLTYAAGDLFLVTEGTGLKVYRVRHDFNHYDRATETMRFREANSIFRIEE